LININDKFFDNHDIRSRYVHFRDLVKCVTYPELIGIKLDQLNITRDIIEHIYMKAYECFEIASNSGIYEAYYYLGLMNYNGLYTKINKNKAFYYYCKAGSFSHALSYFELYQMLKKDDIIIYDNDTDKKKAMFDYLKMSAEEGYPAAMYELANEYIKGELCEVDHYLSLAWHRHACRNGYYLSYVFFIKIGTNRRSIL
jgi:TPR repeat protein